MEPQRFAIRPLTIMDCAVIGDHAQWGTPRIFLSPACKGIGAITPDGMLQAYCGFFQDVDWLELRITAIQSRMRGAGTALLQALKERAYALIAEDVLASAVTWWEKHDFGLWYPATPDDEEGVIGTYWWCRDDDPLLVAQPYIPMWPNHRAMIQLAWDADDPRWRNRRP
jgi:hypothetical protein